MGVTRLLAAACVGCTLWSAASSAQHLGAPRFESGEITVDAEQVSYDKRTDTVVARGNVVIRRGETEVRADEVQLDRRTNTAEARGHVSVTDAEGTMSAENMDFNLDEETGALLSAQVHSRRGQYSLSGDRIEKGPGYSFHIENGRFTTCHCTDGPQSWSISGKELDVTLGGYGALKGGTFNVLDVPVLYLPRALFPVQRDRQSGFLLPRFGASNTRGFQSVVPYYWAINKSQDATVALDVETSARVGLVGEYRYALSRETRGILSASYFNEAFRGTTTGQVFEATIPQSRWSIVSQHDQPFIGTSKAYADVFLVSDDLFLREINTYAFDHAHQVAIRTAPYTESHAGVIQLWNRLAVKGEATYYQDLIDAQSQALERFPQLDVWGQSRIGEHVLGDLTASTTDFQRTEGVDGLRVDLAPGAMVPLPLGRSAFGALHASVRETAYHLTDQTLVPGTQQLPQNSSRETMQAGAEIGTAFNRIYPVQWWGLEKVKHTLEPEVAYLYVPAVSEADLPLFDGIDRINHRNLLTYGVVSRFIGKFAADAVSEPGHADPGGAATLPASSVRELARFSVMQSFDFSREIHPLQAGRGGDHFSDVDLDGRINPSRALSVRFHTNYDTGINDISAARVGFFIEDPRRRGTDGAGPRLETRTSAGVSYRFLAGNQLQEVDDNIVLRLTDWAGFLYSSRYDVVSNRFLDNFFGLRFISLCDCWALDLALTDRTNPHEVEFRAQLTLAGFGASRSQSRTAVPY
jgi:LPS-assembly protein